LKLWWKKIRDGLLYRIVYRAILAIKRTLDYLLLILLLDGEFKGTLAYRASENFHEVSFHHPSLCADRILLQSFLIVNMAVLKRQKEI
jgi:hypothetical protein